MSQHIVFYHQQIAVSLVNHMLIEHVCRGRANTQCRAQGVLCCRGCRGSVGCNGSECMQGQCRYVVFCGFVGVEYVCRVGMQGLYYAFVGLCRCLQACAGLGVCRFVQGSGVCRCASIWCEWMQQCRLYKRVLVTSMQTANVFVRSLFFCLYYQILSNTHINIYIQQFFCPQRLRKRCSREKTTRVTSALWWYRFTALIRLCNLPELHVVGGIQYPSLLQEVQTNLRN